MIRSVLWRMCLDTRKSDSGRDSGRPIRETGERDSGRPIRVSGRPVRRLVRNDGGWQWIHREIDSRATRQIKQKRLVADWLLMVKE